VIPPYPERCEAREANLAGEETYCMLAAGHRLNHTDGMLEWSDDAKPVLFRATWLPPPR
jgi:hypothetical protein